MALTAFQVEVLRHLAPSRSPDSVFGGGATLNRDGPRRSRDFDIEHIALADVEAAYRVDWAALVAAGYDVEASPASRPERGFAEAVVRSASGSTLVDWTYDSPVRFFPAEPDAAFGWRLHDFDLAINTILAMAGRREPRDYHDVVTLHRSGLPLAALAWAACGKDAGLAPGLVLDEVTCNACYTAEEIAASIDIDGLIDVLALKRDLLRAVAEARDLFASLPLEQAGFAYLDAEGWAYLPDPAGVASGRLVLHGARTGGSRP